MKYPIFVKWIYAPREEDDGIRILVDRLWPYGRDRDELGVDHWWRDTAPSSALKRQYSQGEINWKDFARLYRNELYTHPERLRSLKSLAEKGKVTLLALEREPEQSHVSLLRESLELWHDQEISEESKSTVIQGR
ncbi:Uncharacterized conserved protein YeaO, DUF488 family [Marinospirillum celere]|uniref:Uncharacterized conserved protein YeaO, DUF488 family n=1 Tax=Marinospirillum celere TaxID=1122252 RepID=A0A1I1E1L7_9GAMM|nr:DUF488 family protein [Marinospirillum celere]SFB78860.1 Uncharacterized conserved protein YeaO, DUF488 family [Marinospirillum celere]